VSTTDPKYPGWEIDKYNVGRAGSVRVDVFHYTGGPEIDIEHDTSWGCTTYVHVPPFVLAAMLRQLGWTVTEPGGGA